MTERKSPDTLQDKEPPTMDLSLFSIHHLLLVVQPIPESHSFP